MCPAAMSVPRVLAFWLILQLALGECYPQTELTTSGCPSSAELCQGTAVSGSTLLHTSMFRKPTDIGPDMDDEPKDPEKAASMNDIKNADPEQVVRRRDQEAAKKFPDALPTVTAMFPALRKARDKDIASKLKGLQRDSIIRLPNNKSVPYWQTLQYADRHFRIYVDRFREGRFDGKWFKSIPEHSKTRVWAASGLLRKVLCSERFRTWVMGRTFKGVTPERVYHRFQSANKGTYAGVREYPWYVLGAANGQGVFFNHARKLLTGGMGQLLSTLAHEQAHNLGFSHRTGVPYPIGYHVKHALAKKFHNYHVHDLAETPDFEVGPMASPTAKP